MEVLIFCCFGIGHYNPCYQLARCLLEHGCDQVTMIIPLQEVHVPLMLDKDEDFTPQPNTWCPRIVDDGRIHQCVMTCSPNVESHKLLFWFIEEQPKWVDKIISIYDNRQAKPNAIFADIAVTADVQLAKHWNVPTYQFYPSPLFLCAIFTGLLESLQNPDEERFIELKGFNGLKLSAQKETLVQQEPDPELIEKFLRDSKEAMQFRTGFVSNDVGSLYTQEAIEAARLHPQFQIHTIGPLALKFDRRLRQNQTVEEGDQLWWLHGEKDNSVILVSMGSNFDIPHEGLQQFCYALEEVKEFKVVWAHRKPKRERVEGTDELGLPEGWLERNKDRVKVYPWINQLAALRHPAIGLFVTHSGWNGITEAIAVGHSPLLMLPVAAEQPGNAKVMEQYYQIGERLWSHPTFGEPLKADVVAEKIRRVISSTTYRDNQKRLNELANAAWDPENGCSSIAVKRLIELVR